MGFGGAAPPSREVGTSPRIGTRLDAAGLPSCAHELRWIGCWHAPWDDALRSDVVRWNM